MIVAGSVLAMLLMGFAVEGFVNSNDEDEDTSADTEDDMTDQSGVASTVLSDLLFAGDDADSEDDEITLSDADRSAMALNYIPLDQIQLDDEEDASDPETEDFMLSDDTLEDSAEVEADSEWAAIASGPAAAAYMDIEDLTGLEDGSEVSFVADFSTETDELVLEFDGTAEDMPDIEVDLDSEEGSAVVLANGIPVTLVEGATDLTAEHVRVLMSGEDIVDSPQVLPTAVDAVEDGPQVQPNGPTSEARVEDGPQVQPDGPDLERALDDDPQVQPGLNLDGPAALPSAPEPLETLEIADKSEETGPSVLPTAETLIFDLNDELETQPEDAVDPLLEEGVETVLDPVETILDEVTDGVPLDADLTQILDALMADMPDLGGAGDMLDARGDIDPAFGTGGEDAQTGTFNDDLVLGADGQDALFGDEGDDTLQGGAGNDELHGDTGHDVLEGGAGIDFLDGGEGDDLLDGGADRDLLFGGDGDDVLNGGAAADFLQGGMGADMMNGGSGDDVLNGTFTQGANGTFTHGAMDQDDADTLWGGDGDDTLIIGQNDMAHGGAGADTFTSGEYIENADVAGHVADFDPTEDRIEVIFDPDVNPNPQVEVQDFEDGSGADILLNGSVILSVSGAQGMDPGLIDLRAVA